MTRAIAMLLAGATALLAACATPSQSQSTAPLREPDRLFVGDAAPDFALRPLDGGRTVRLSQFKGDRPVVLVFGSYT